MLRSLTNWYMRRRQRIPDAELIRAYQATFGIGQGQVVLQHLMDTIYCQVYDGDNPVEAYAVNAKRQVVHEILILMDMEIPSDQPPTIEEFLKSARNGG